MKRSVPPSSSGFTLLEIMLVVSIIVLLLGGAIYKMMPMLGAAKANRAFADITSMKTALMTYETMAGSLPSTSQGLGALVTRPTSAPTPRSWAKIMDEMPTDPWNRPYVYVQPGTHNPSGYDLYSLGEDGQANTIDDIGNWSSTTK